MPPTPAPQDGAGATAPLPEVDPALPLSSRALAWLAKHPRAGRLVRSVWDKLIELEDAGQDCGASAALRRVLACHLPTAGGRCGMCRRLTWRHLWRRRSFPCIVWHQVHGDLLSPLADRHRHRKPTGRET